MKKILIASALVMVTAGCQPGSKSPGSAGQPEIQKELLNSGHRTSETGNVPSPDDKIRDSVARQDAMKDLQSKVFKIAARLKMDAMGTTETDETAQLLKDFTSRKAGAKQLDITDALFNGTLDAAVKIEDLQGEFTDKEMPKLAIQRSFEKIATAYGFDKDQTKLIVAAIEKREHLLNLSDDQIQFIHDLSENIKKKTVALINDFKEGNDNQLCGALAIFANNYSNYMTFKSKIELPSLIANRAAVTSVLQKTIESCKADITQARKNMGSQLPGVIKEVDRSLQLVELYVDPATSSSLPLSLEIMDRWKLDETKEVLEARNQSLTGDIAANGIVCRVGDKVYGTIVQSSDAESSTAEVDFELAGEKPFKLRKMQGQRGVTLVYMSSKTNVLNLGNSTPVNAGEGFVATVANMAPGSAPLKMVIGSESSPITVECQAK
ncbi:hypothetical protein [Bdellovibrio sp. GT3]|uniref:hypothetical protein n=1 Tax=Bdellovibrio sp. GT3 TaxID=3136282 RepID=UPI0030F06E48